MTTVHKVILALSLAALAACVNSGRCGKGAGGEPAIITMGAVVANAIYDAVGVKLFQLPMTPERIREAMKKG